MKDSTRQNIMVSGKKGTIVNNSIIPFTINYYIHLCHKTVNLFNITLFYSIYKSNTTILITSESLMPLDFW